MLRGKIDIKSKTIQNILAWAYKDEIQINRRYQRKLVWSLQEKQNFIISILEQIPVPSIILAYSRNEKGEANNEYEVIDGLQRLDAILSFLKNKFSIVWDGRESFFNLKSDSNLFNDLNEGILIQKEECFDLGFCQDFLEIELPVTIADVKISEIDNIFRKINSSGQRLSAQELRQSSVCNEFSELVRKMACIVRGDYTYSDLININDMPKISVSQKGLDYGIDSKNVFWIKNGIITFDNLRKSRDEELIAKLLLEVLIDVKRPSAEQLDRAYNVEEDYCIQLCEKIRNSNDDYLMIFQNVYNTLLNVFTVINSDFSTWCFKSKKVIGKNDCFLLLLEVMFELYIEGYIVYDYQLFGSKLKLLADNYMKPIQNEYISRNNWENVKENIYDILKNNMKLKLHNDKTLDIIMEIEKRLSMSSVENQMTEYKNGFSNFKNDSFKKEILSDIIRTLCAMSNTEKIEDGMVVVGIADNSKQAIEWANIYKSKPIVFLNHYILGLDKELSKFNLDKDVFIQKVKDLIKKEPIEKEVMDYITGNYIMVNYHGRELLIFKIKHFKHSVLYHNIEYVRRGNSTEKK